MSDHPTTVSSGTLIMGTYEIERLINSGGMGEVYRGRNIHNGEPVAIKIVLPSLAHDPKIVALFQKESTVLSRLSHEAIVRYHVFTVDPTIGRPCMVMEFVSGTAMSDRIEAGPMPVDEVRVMLRRVASGLDKAHRAGVVHRDLSPDNVILEDGHVEHAKLIDFGIAKSTALGAGTLLQGQFAGKFNWVSPEQLGAFGGVVDGRSDIYSLGLITAGASKGEVLQMGASIVDAVGKRASVPDLAGVDPSLVPLLTWMLQPDPGLRPESMAQVMAAVDNPALVPQARAPEPKAVDPNRTVIGEMLPIPEPKAVSVPTTSTAPVSIPPVTPMASKAPLMATVIAPVTQTRATQAPENDDVSPFGAAVASVVPPMAEPLVVKKSKGGMVAIVALLALGGGTGAAYFGGIFDGKVTPAGSETQAQAEARVQAEQAAAEAVKQAEADAAAKQAADEAAKQAEAEAAAKKVADEAATQKAADDAAAQKATDDAAAAEAAKQAEAEAAAKKAADDAAAAEAAKQAEAAAKKAANDAAAAKAAKQAEAEAAAKKVADDAAAAKAAKQAEAEAAAKKVADDAAAAQKAAEAAKRAEAEAAAQKLADEAAAKKAADDAATKQAAAAEAAAKADPIATQTAYFATYSAPLCTRVAVQDAKASGFTLNGYTTDPNMLAGFAEAWQAVTYTKPDLTTQAINPAQCAVLDFLNAHPAKAAPVQIVLSNDTVLKSGGKISGKVDGLGPRALSLFIFTENGGATNLAPWQSVGSDGAIHFELQVSLPAKAPPAPQLIVAIATAKPIPGADKVPAKVTAQSLIPYLEKALAKAGEAPTLGFAYVRLEN